MSEPYLMDLVYDWLTADEVEAAAKIEEQGYPPDEAGSLKTFRYRQSEATKLFLAVYLLHHNDTNARELIGYVCSTLSPSKSLTHESMSTHVPASSSVCIHSVCISPPHQRKGVGLSLLREYISRLSESALYERVLLLAHAELRPFYEKAGFEWVGRSDVVHGSRPWFEMRMILGSGLATPAAATTLSAPAQIPPATQQQLPPGILEQLQRPSHNPSTPRLLASFPNGISDVLLAQQANKFDLVCPRSECGSVILKHGVAQLVDRLSVQMEPPEYTPHPLLPALPNPPATTSWWLVTPSPMAFENIGFSRPVQSQSQVSGTPGKTLKLLSCAECDLGPLGWSEGGTEFWLACSRVGYRV